jgi:hypothetical protein
MRALFSILIVAACNLAIAADESPLLGTFKVFSFSLETNDGAFVKDYFGEHPTGYVVFTPKRFISVIAADKTLARLFTGENFGKQLLKIADPPLQPG